jgi:ACT domain-containing protein
MSDEVQEVVEEVDQHLKSALEHANTHMSHDDIRPSALMAFDEVEEARQALNKIDERDFTTEEDDG